MALELGFIALADAAPLIVAKARGYFGEEGLDVALHREVSWATIRDKVAAGVFQGAHMLAPMALAANMGVGSEPTPLIVPMALNAHGASLGISRALAAEMERFLPEAPLDVAALAAVVAARAASGRPAVSFATVFPYSMHAYMLRYWAASGGVDPDRDIRIVVAAPTAIAARLKSGEIDGFCVGAPWGAMCEADSAARIALRAATFWPGGPDKVLGLSQSWADADPAATMALVRALIRAAVWADAPENAAELAKLLSRREWLDAPATLIGRALASGPDQIRFARHAALYPWRSHAAWILSQQMRWGQIGAGIDASTALACYRPDVFRAACLDAGINAPSTDSKIEGAHDRPWNQPGLRGSIPMTADLILGGGAFDPERLHEYAAGFAISRLGS
ncbi:MAG: thiamine biosynthesis protein [Alphaproteobacteria bacterium]|nr:thiamine biosynthesis protein [Alphaproteobacteria bacterium]